MALHEWKKKNCLGLNTSKSHARPLTVGQSQEMKGIESNGLPRQWLSGARQQVFVSVIENDFENFIFKFSTVNEWNKLPSTTAESRKASHSSESKREFALCCLMFQGSQWKNDLFLMQSMMRIGENRIHLVSLDSLFIWQGLVEQGWFWTCNVAKTDLEFLATPSS